jgi:hypothetical protein
MNKTLITIITLVWGIVFSVAAFVIAYRIICYSLIDACIVPAMILAITIGLLLLPDDNSPGGV